MTILGDVGLVVSAVVLSGCAFVWTGVTCVPDAMTDVAIQDAIDAAEVGLTGAIPRLLGLVSPAGCGEEIGWGTRRLNEQT